MTVETKARRLSAHGVRVVAEILDGDRPHKDLKIAFDWEATPEGHAYWSEQRQRAGLSSAAHDKLRRMLADSVQPIAA